MQVTDIHKGSRNYSTLPRLTRIYFIPARSVTTVKVYSTRDGLCSLLVSEKDAGSWSTIHRAARWVDLPVSSQTTVAPSNYERFRTL